MIIDIVKEDWTSTLYDEIVRLCSHFYTNYKYWAEFYMNRKMSGGAFNIPHRTIYLGDNFIRVFPWSGEGPWLYEVHRDIDGCRVVGFQPAKK